jgi:hypothetical protein
MALLKSSNLLPGQQGASRLLSGAHSTVQPAASMFLPKSSTSAPFNTALLLHPTHLPHLLLHAVWTAYMGDATDRLSASKVSTAFFALAPL